MSEHMMPIPSRVYNAAVGGHVAGADQIIDDETGLTLDKVTGGALEEKEYTSGSNNGMGRVVLRKNLVEGVNTLVQTMINKSNTIYVIQYDFTLGEDITVPANCVLEFDGGSISGAYTITGTNTKIIAEDVAIFKSGVIIDGSWVCPRITSDWFNDLVYIDANTPNTNRLQQLVNLSSNDVDNHIVVKQGNYEVANPENSVGPLRLKSNTVFEMIGNIKLKPNSFTNGYIIELINNVTNIRICGNGELVGDYLLGHIISGLDDAQWGYNIALGECSNITIEGITSRNACGDGICAGIGYATAPCKGIVIKNCHIHTCRRQGISVVYCDGITIEQCYIQNIYGKYWWAPVNDYVETANCIDVECDDTTYINNVIIRNNKIINKKGIQVDAVAANMSNILIDNNDVTFSKYWGIYSNGLVANYSVTISNNFIKCSEMSVTNPDDSDSTEVESSAIYAEKTYNIVNNTIESSNLAKYSINAEDSHLIGNFIDNRVHLNSAFIKLSQCLFDSNICATKQISATDSEISNNNLVFISNTTYVGVKSINSLKFYNNNISSINAGNGYLFMFNGQGKIRIADNKVTSLIDVSFIGVCQNDGVKEVEYRDNVWDFTVQLDLNYELNYIIDSTPGCRKKGLTAQKPSLHAQYSGAKYYDIELNKEVLWNGTAWIDATGTPI